jgi:hypothetical protein
MKHAAGKLKMGAAEMLQAFRDLAAQVFLLLLPTRIASTTYRNITAISLIGCRSRQL